MNFNESLFVDREIECRGFKKLLLPETAQTVMVVRAPEKMGKTWLALAMEEYCRRPDVNLPVARIDFRNPLDVLKITDHLAFVRFLRDRFEEPNYFHHLNATINRLTTTAAESTEGGSRRIAQLADQIQSVFNLAELQRLSSLLDVEFENLEGTTLYDKAFALAAHFARRNRVADLLDELAARRDHVDWRGSFGDLLPSNVSAPSPDGAIEPDVSGGLALPDIIVQDITVQADQQRSLVGLGATEISRAEHLINDAFFDCIANLIADRGQVVFLLDGYEHAPRVAADFMVQQLLVHLLDERLSEMTIVLTGRETPDISDPAIRPLVVHRELEPFGREHVRDFMVTRNILEDSGRWDLDTAAMFSGGVPGILALMADQARVRLEHDSFFD